MKNSKSVKYYFAGTSMIALRKDGVLNFILGDHLGSTSLTTDADGVVISELLYTAWGEVRHESGVTATNHTYTGQYSNVSDFGLMYYRARWMDPQLGRFSQPDTIIPSNQGVQAWDRFAYVNNNPVRYTDPTGHYCIQCLVIIGVIATTAYIYSTPLMQELGQQAKAGIENAVQMAKSGQPSTKHRKNENNLATMGTIYNFPENPPPNFKFKEYCKNNRANCYTLAVFSGIVAGVRTYQLFTCAADETKCIYTKEPGRLVIPSGTPSPTQTILPDIDENVDKLFPPISTPPPPSPYTPPPPLQTGNQHHIPY
jgi:RHS repeat-associated protein